MFNQFIIPMLCSMSFGLSYGNEDEMLSQNLRIHELMPQEHLFFSLGIEPALPADFISMSFRGKRDYIDWVYWGPKDVLQTYFDTKSLSEPVIRVSFSYDTNQDMMEQWSDEEIQSQIGDVLSIKRGFWGRYPYLLAVYKIEDKIIHAGWVGLDLPERRVLLFNLVKPSKEKEFSDKALQLWDTFFNETKELPVPLFLKAMGQEMHHGYTITNHLGHKIKVIAERRKHDGQVQVFFIPMDPEVWFEYRDAFEIPMPLEWHHGEALLKINGAVHTTDQYQATVYTTASVFTKEVDEFSVVPVLKKNTFSKTIPAYKLYPVFQMPRD
jgi:hypothetical protein